MEWFFIIKSLICIILLIALFIVGIICYFFIILSDYKDEFWDLVKEDMNEGNNGKNKTN